MAGNALRVGGRLIDRNRAQQDITQEGVGEPDAMGLGHQGAHGPVDAHDPRPGGHSAQRGDVAETDDPLGMGGDVFQRQEVGQLDGAVAAAVAQDGLDVGILERPLEVRKALPGRAGVFPKILFPDVRAHDRLEAPFAEDHRCSVHILHRGVVGRRDKGDLVSFLQERRLDAMQGNRLSVHGLSGAGRQKGKRNQAGCQNSFHHYFFGSAGATTTGACPSSLAR